MLYGYVSFYKNIADESKLEAKQAIKDYVASNELQIEKIIEDGESNRTVWTERAIANVIENDMVEGDELIVYEASNLARSTSQVLEIMSICLAKSIKIHFVKYSYIFDCALQADTKEILGLLFTVESDFISKRTTEALARRRQAGLPLGRPKGRKNKQRKLDKHRDDIIKYLRLNVSKASIAKLVGCHPQTLYDYIDLHELTAETKTSEDIAKEKEASGIAMVEVEEVLV